MVEIREGYMPFGEYKTYYRIAGECAGEKKPLLLLHGGPGSTHNYFELFDCLAEEGRAVISYDQLGCGQSSMPDCKELWTLETWTAELKALKEYLHLGRFHLLGQSWGGMLAIRYLCNEHDAVASAILSSSVPSVKLWGQEGMRLTRLLPDEMQAAYLKAAETGDYSDKEALAALMMFEKRHCIDMEADNLPECLTRKKNFGRQAFHAAWGDNESFATGSLKDFEYLEQMRTIKEPVLITSGVDDECTPLVAKSMYDRVPNARWELFEKSAHMAFVTEREKYMKLMWEWMREND